MSKDMNKEFAFYAASLFKIGNYVDAALISSILFERAIYQELEKHEVSKENIANICGSGKAELWCAIDELNKKYEVPDIDLHEIRKHSRNELTHEMELEDLTSDFIEKMVTKIWYLLDIDRYKEFEGKPEKIDFLRADYHVVGMREMFNDNVQDLLAQDYKFNTFKIEDFQELNVLRQKMISLGSKIKNELLKTNYKNELYIDILSKVDTTSAYVWMSMNLRNEKRERIISASASVLGTPLNLRIYFDIGGGAYKVREDYYKFLKSEYFKNFKKNENTDDMEIFDNDWYCFIIDRWKLSELTDDKINEMAEVAEEKLAQYNEHDILSWNRMLCGYIIDRGNISYADIKCKLVTIIKLYYCFEYFRQHELGYKDIKFKYDVGSLCSNSVKKKLHRFSEKEVNIQKIRGRK